MALSTCRDPSFRKKYILVRALDTIAAHSSIHVSLLSSVVPRYYTSELFQCYHLLSVGLLVHIVGVLF